MTWFGEPHLNRRLRESEMSEMIERVAKAILDEMDITDGLDGSAAARYARAAIEAMREPTEAMLEAGPGEPYMDRVVWAKMISEALK